MGWAPPGTRDREVSPSRGLGGGGQSSWHGLLQGRMVGGLDAAPSSGLCAQGLGMETGEMCLDVGAVK